MNIHHQRLQYGKDQLVEANLPDDPLELFSAWFELAQQKNIFEANAMLLSTASENKPSARIVLLKEISDGGFVFFTNYNSRKGQELAKNPSACLTFFWPELEKQIRIEGTTEMISKDISTSYFDSRPIESRISAIISPQSEVIASRNILEDKRRSYITLPLEEIKKPEHWGGYRLLPSSIEFWQGGADRLHDRIEYVKTNNNWKKHRLAP